MTFNITEKYLRDTVKKLAPLMETVNLASATVNGQTTTIDYWTPSKGYILTHNNKKVQIQKARDAKFIYNYYVGTKEDININDINALLSNPIH